MKKILLGILINILLSQSVYSNEKTEDYEFIDLSRHSRFKTFSNDKVKPTFNNNTVEWYYNPKSQHLSAFQQEDIINAFKNAMQSWSKVSGVIFSYKGITNNNIKAGNDEIITVGFWPENTYNKDFGNFSGTGASMWRTEEKKIFDGYIVLNAGDNGDPSVPNTLNDLEGLITHEVGHLLGIGHSDVEESIMYTKPYHSYDFQRTLRQDDINIARLLYPINEPVKPISGNPPICDAGLNPQTIKAGEGTTLWWWSDNVVSASINNGIGNVSVPSDFVWILPKETTTYTVTAKDANGATTTCQATLTVESETPVSGFPICEVGVDPQVISAGEGTALWWWADSVVSASINNGIGNASIPSDYKWIYPKETTTFTMIAKDSNGVPTTCQTTLTVESVNSASEPPICELGADPQVISAGEGTALWWWTDNVTAASISSTSKNSTVTLPSDYFWIKPSQTETYIMNAVAEDGTTSTCQTTVTVK
ncbi:MAG: matrixin family metalloprotease [Methylococcales bacterium]|nr:matrixin family metalloprotease [Methylococcales bacterium]